MTKSIPKRPNLEFDRKQARALLKEVVGADPAARSRFKEHHPRGIPKDPQLADAFLVIAREYGFASWPQWKTFVETRNLGRQEQANVPLRAICSNQLSQARVLLKADPELVFQDIYIASACGEVEFVKAAVKAEPGAVSKKGGVLGWTPLEYACFSRWLRADGERAQKIVQVAHVLIDAGADPNAVHETESMGQKTRETVLLGAAGIANNAELTRLLLEAGADADEQLPPPDRENPKASPWGSEALYHSCEFRDTRCLALLLNARPHPLRVSYCLGRSLDFENPEAVQLFLEHDADPNLRIPWMGMRTQLHRAVQSQRSAEVIKALIEAGGDIRARDDSGRTPYQYAIRYGRADIALLMEQNGATGATEEDYLLGRIARGEKIAARGEVPPDFLCDAARRNDVPAIQALLAAGAKVDAWDPGEYGTAPLHWAAWRGHYEAVRALVEHGADIHAPNCYGAAVLGAAIHGSENCFDLDGGPALRLPEEAIPGDYSQIVKFLLSKGAQPPRYIWGGSEPVREVLRLHGVPDEPPQATS